MKVVFVLMHAYESPDDIAAAQALCAQVVAEGDVPVEPHTALDSIVLDGAQRQRMAVELLKRCDEVLACPHSSMTTVLALEAARMFGKPVRYAQG